MKKIIFTSFFFFFSFILFSQSTIDRLLTYEKENTLHFEGEGDYVDLGNSVGNEVRTIEMWFKLDIEINPFIDDFVSLTARETALTNENEFSLSFLPNFKGHPGHLRFNITEALGQEYSVYSDNDKWLANEWHHVAAVVHEQKGMMLFIDGIKQNSTNTYTQAPVANIHTTTLGCWGDLYSRYYRGSLDDVRFSDKALYIDDFESPCPDQIVLPSTIGLWNFNDDYDNIARDISGHDQDGIVYGASWVYDSICSVVYIQGNALLFDGDDDYVDLGSQAGIGVRTIEFWFSPSEDISVNNTKYITFVAREGGGNNENEFDVSLLPEYKSELGKLEFGIADAYGEKHVIFSKSRKWKINSWYHIAAVVHPRDGMMLFVDGIKQENTNIYQESTQESKYITTLASWGLLNGMYFSGKMEDVRFSNKALYSNDFIPQCPNLEVLPSTIGLWRFNGSRDIAKDRSENSYDGHIYGAERITVDVCEDYHPEYDNTENQYTDDIVRVHINPSKDIFEFIFNDVISFSSNKIEIYASNGNFILSQKINADKEYVDLSNIQPGVYYYHIVNSGKIVSTGKLVKL